MTQIEENKKTYHGATETRRKSKPCRGSNADKVNKSLNSDGRAKHALLCINVGDPGNSGNLAIFS
jgi:hypothetical protein